VRSVLNEYYQSLTTNTFDASQVSKLFVSDNATFAQRLSSILIPSDPTVLPYAGLFLGQQNIRDYFYKHSLETNEPNNPMLNSQLIFDGGSVAVIYRLQGTTKRAPSMSYECSAIDYFQMTTDSTDGKIKIGRLTRFFDTWAVTVASTGGLPFPQTNFSSLSSMVSASLTDYSAGMQNSLKELSNNFETVLSSAIKVRDAESLAKLSMDTVAAKIKDTQSTQVFLVIVLLLQSVFLVSLLFCNARIRTQKTSNLGNDMRASLLDNIQ